MKKAYKYRSNHTLDRDIESLENNSFWCPQYLELNDPCETIIESDLVREDVELLRRIFGAGVEQKETLFDALDVVLERRRKIGIYSLSSSPAHELLWAYYANSHKGFCIEYDLDRLSKNEYQELHTLKIDYKKKPPSVSWKDFVKEISLHQFLRKMAGTKSLKWSHEEEIRLVSDKIGANYYPFDALIGIYFGYRMSKEDKLAIMKRLKGREVQYYQMRLMQMSYEFYPDPVEDLFSDAHPYIGVIEKTTAAYSYKITDINLKRMPDVGKIDIELSERIPENVLRELCLDIKQKLFYPAIRVFFSFLLNGMTTGRGNWASARIEDGELTTSMHCLSQEDYSVIIAKLEAYKSKGVVGVWMNEEPYSSQGIIIEHQDDKWLMRNISKDGEREEILEQLTSTESVKLVSELTRHHGEFFTIDDKKTLHFHSKENGIYKSLRELRIR